MTIKTNFLSLLICTVLLCTACNAILFGLEGSALFGLLGYEYDPLSVEEIAAAEDVIQGDVYWSAFGKVYHTDLECHALNDYDELTVGTVKQAMDANRTRLCSYCAKRDGIENVKTDDADRSGYDPNAEAAMNATVYWVKDGDAYHFTPDCAALADADILFVGSTEEAQNVRITLPCSICTDINK